jgi:hypothetical protein
MRVLETAAISVSVGVLSRLLYNVLVNNISSWLTDRQRAFFGHYKQKHPGRSLNAPRYCEIGSCVLIPPRRRLR